MTKRVSRAKWASAALAVMIQATLVSGASAANANQLGAEMTPMGAERAGNAEGTIPEWTGGLSKAPAGWKKGDYYVDSFADDKPILTITRSNYQQYADKLNEGQRTLFEKYSEYAMNVYPTQRSFAAPEAIYNNTRKNATDAKLSGDGVGVENAYGGVPFPLPQSGIETVWNHLLRWQGYGVEYNWASWLVYPSGTYSQSSGGLLKETYPFYTTTDENGYAGGELLNFLAQYQEPERRAGEIQLIKDPLNQAETPRQAWQYIAGQRRVRRAPTIAFDTPNGPTAVMDETYLFNGSPERFDWKLVGKQEMFVPYNMNKYYEAFRNKADADKVLQANFPNPEYMRWELHRVWVVEGTLKEGSRHVYSKRRLYIDEDSWAALLADNYDGQGQIWRTLMQPSFVAYDVPAMVSRGEVHWDLQSDIYLAQTLPVSSLEFKAIDAKEFSVSHVRKLGRR